MQILDIASALLFPYSFDCSPFDRMDYRRGQECIDRMMKSKFKKLLIVERAGHQLYMEKPSGFNKTMLTALKMDGTLPCCGCSRIDINISKEPNKAVLS